ncbi:MAG: exopolysaccharide biosynthesis protein [Gammaproteobacteria bacterium]|nr:exopolysaccharide biosynthesis protein [Gammaproteobacteria bacterium]
MLMASATADARASTSNDRALLHHLKLRLAGLLEFLPVHRPIVYLDYPVHLNFGDLLIMRGTEQFYADHGHRVLSRSAYMNFLDRGKSRISSETILVMHGGGNFGDLYPVHQNFREEIVRRFPDNRIVILPQSVYFSSPEELERSARVFRQHRNVVLCVRDHESLAKVRARFTHNSVLMPDMAHQLWRPHQPHPPTGGRTLKLLRLDAEAWDHQGPADMERHAMDWLDYHPRWSCWIFGRILWLHTAEGRFGRELGARALWYRYCELLHRRMESRFLEYSEIITSRLHGMIFGLLLGKRVRYLDNIYGKLSGYARTWFDDSLPVAPYLGIGSVD